MSILADVTNHGRDFKSDIRELTGTNSMSLPDNSLFLDENGPWVIEAENWVLDVLDSRGATVPAPSSNDDYKYLYYACLYRLACIIWNDLLGSDVISEKSPDYEFRLDLNKFNVKRDEICGRVETWFDLLDAPAPNSVFLDVVRGDSDSDYQNRPNGI